MAQLAKGRAFSTIHFAMNSRAFLTSREGCVTEPYVQVSGRRCPENVRKTSAEIGKQSLEEYAKKQYVEAVDRNLITQWREHFASRVSKARSFCLLFIAHGVGFTAE